MKQMLALLLAVCLLLCACNSPAPQPSATDPVTVPSAPPATDPTEPSTAEPTAQPTEAATQPPTEPAILARHPLTGEALEEPFTGRPIAININNSVAAQPLHGIGQADILYEIMNSRGGYVTRCLAVFSDISQVDQVGPIRSARTYLVNLARGHNAVYVHCGGSTYANKLLAENVCTHVNQMNAVNQNYFYRDQDRLDDGYASEHTLFSNGTSLLNCFAARDISLEGSYPTAAQFSEDATPEGEAAQRITVRFGKGASKTTTMTYDADSGCYTGLQHWSTDDKPLIDANTDTAIPFRNVLVLLAQESYIKDHVFYELEGEGDGYFACGGKIVPIRWHRSSLDEPFTYTLTDGTPLALGIGKSYVAILPMGSPVVYE